MSQIYSLLNDIQTDPDSYDREDLTGIESERMRRTIRSKYKKKGHRSVFAGTACAAIAVLIIGNTAFADEVHAAAKSIEWQIGNFLGIDKELQDYVTVLNTSQTDKGYTITLNEVILDENELIVSSTIKSEKPIDDRNFMTFADVYVNGRNASGSAGGAEKRLDDYTMESVIKYGLENVDTDGKLDFEIHYNQMGLEENAVMCNLVFRFTTDGSALAIDTRHVPMDVSYVLPNGTTIKLTEFTSNNLDEKIYFEIPDISKMNGVEYDMQLEGKDDLGNKVEFYMSSMNGEKGTGCFNSSDPINENAKSIKLKPYAVKFPETSGRLSNDFKPVGDEFTIELK